MDLPSMAENGQLDAADPVAAPPPEKRACICCYETDPDKLIRACGPCQSDYCRDCLVNRFVGAVQDPTMFPVHCCTLIHIHTVLPHLSDEHAHQYRARFEEWAAPTKTYCPSPSCSVFLSERKLEMIKSRSRTTMTLRQLLINFLSKMEASPFARFFREELDITNVSGHTLAMKKSINLRDIQAKIDTYTSVEEFTRDVQLINNNAHLYGSDHPVAEAADGLFDLCLHEMSEATDDHVLANHTTLINCPTCRIAMCGSCDKVAEWGHVCDDTERKQELAMLKKFGYKRCPRCGQGVKKMFGCSHVVCRCGAGFCWTCGQSIDVCQGACGAPGADNEEVIDGTAIEESNAQMPGSGDNQAEPENLDAGGAERWHEWNFGDEPEEGAYNQVWSCHHLFKKWRGSKDGFFHGDLQLIECNRCFKACPMGEGASRCKVCGLLVCSSCEDFFEQS